MSSSGNATRAHEANDSFPKMHIVVMGGAGVGKSSFIQCLVRYCNAGEYPEMVGHRLKCCTKDVVEYQFKLDGRQGSIFDTPGFDDDGLDEGEVLAKIADYSRSTYEANLNVTAIFYLHEITRPRFSGSQIQMLDVFEKLCGRNSLHNVVIVTTKWDQLPKDDPIGESREKELLNEYMAMLVKLGAKHARHDNSVESVLRIVRPVMCYSTTKTRLQEELVDEGKDLQDTEAGKRVAQDLREKIDQMQKDWEKEQKSFQEKIKESNEKWAEELRKQREKDAETHKKTTAKLQRDLDKLKSNKPGLMESTLNAMPNVLNAVNESFKLYNTFTNRAESVRGASGTSEQRTNLSSTMEEVRNFVQESLEAAALQEHLEMSEWP